MTRQPTTLLALTLTLILAGSGLAAANSNDFYVDDAREYIDTEIIERSGSAPAVEPLDEGLDPLVIEPKLAQPDDLRLDAAKDGVTNDGTGPLVGTNFIRIYISNAHVNADSATDYIIVRFGHESGNDDGSSANEFRLWGYWDGSSRGFPAGYALTWDLTGMRSFLEDLPQDKWDEISFVTPSGDGMLIRRVMVVHSGQEILDWTVNRWLDAPNHTTLGCAQKIMQRKLQYVNNTDHAALHFGALEIGKTNGKKYGTGNLWCSEFASWALFREGFMTPYGNIGTVDMKAWFSARGRLYTRSQVRNKTYVPKPGDYLSINNGDHSCLFLRWVDSTDTITNSTQFLSLDGNWGQTVQVVTRTVSVIDRVGKAQ